MVGDLTYNSLQDLLGQVFLQLTVFVAYKMLKVPGAAAEGFASCHWCLAVGVFHAHGHRIVCLHHVAVWCENRQVLHTALQRT